MSLVTAIEFNNLAAQLTVEETKRFINNLTISYPQLINNLLSSRFISQSRADTEDSLNLHCNDSITAIIRSRNTDCSTSNVATFDALPRLLIGHCGSFLDQKSYRALSQCNRSTYLGTNSPIMLRELTVRYPVISESADLSLDLALFPMANKLTLNICNDSRRIEVHKMKLMAAQMAKMRRLRCLDLQGLNLDHKLIEILAKQERINQNVRWLGLDNPPLPSISVFKNLQFLCLNIECEYQRATDSEMKAIFQSLSGVEGLRLIDSHSPFGHQLLVAIGQQLKYLELNYIGIKRHGNGPYGNLQSINFRNLEQLMIGDECLYDLSRKILKTATNLEKARIDCTDESVGRLTDRLLLIADMLERCEKLQHFEISCTFFVGQILDTMTRGLFRSRNFEKKELKIIISASFHSFNEDGLVMKLDGVINQLLICKVDQWMLLLKEYEGDMETTVIKKLTASMHDLHVDLRVLEDKENKVTVISSPECVINGYATRWLMS